VRRAIALISLLFITSFAQAQSVSTPRNVSAFIYSSSAAELFWTPRAGHLIEVTRNGELLGRFDTHGLYQSSLQRGKEYSYTLRSIDSTGRRSQAIKLAINTANFSSPDKRLYPISDNNTQAQAEPPQNAGAQVTNQNSNSAIVAPGAVSAFIYSSSTVELFWTPQADTLVEVVRNGEVLGRYGSRSLYQPGLEKGKRYEYKLQSVGRNDQRSAPITMVLNTANFVRPDLRIFPSGSSTPDNATTPAQPNTPVQPNIDKPVVKPVVINTDITNVPPPTVNPPTKPPQNDPVTQTGNGCVASNVNSLLSCVRNAGANQRIEFSKDITCGSNCCPSGGALLNLAGKQNLEITGNGHRLLRTSGHRQCSLLDINNASNIRINNVFLDDDKRVGGCQVEDRCPRMIHVRSSKNIGFNQTHISHGKGYAFYVQGTNGFKFENGSLHNSGVLGMYIGHGNDASSNIRISGSTFSDNQTNGLAIRGLRGASISANLVANNVFIRNHRRGQWAVAPQFGTGFTGGGQVYIAQAANLTVRDNIVRDGYCDNCFVQRKNRSGVSGIEMGLPNQASVQNMIVSGNKVSNHDAFGISQNANSQLNNVRLSNNQLLNNSSGTQKPGNRVINTQRFDSFEAGNDVGGVYQGAVSCSANGSVSRQCGAQSRFGQCAVQLRLGNADCNDIKAELLGPRVAVRDGQSVIADGWVRNPVGKWCLIFRDGSGNKLAEKCKNLSEAPRSDIQPFVGMPGIDAASPAGSRTVQLSVSHSQAGASMMLDDLKLSVGN